MKRYISYFAVLLAVLLGAACSKDDSAAGSDNRTGVMAMTVSTRQTADTGEYDPLQHQTVYIYNDEGGLLRKYTSKEALSRTAGTVGRHLSRSGRSRRGSPRRFHETVIQGRGDVHRQTRRNHKRCGRLPDREHRRRGEIRRFDPPEPLPGYSVWIAGGEKVDEEAAEAGSVPALRFTTEGTGYYTLPPGHDVAGLALPRNACRG